MRIGVFGGSFHPPHVGHAMIAGWLRWTGLVDEVWLVPAYEHAFGKALAPFDDRVAWCVALADAVGPWIRVDPVERDLGGTSYTIRTLDALAARHPEHALRLVVGADVLPETPRWRAWARIADVYTPIVVGRAGCPPVVGAPQFPDISSTHVRACLAGGDDVSHLVPATVMAAIRASAPVRWR